MRRWCSGCARKLPGRWKAPFPDLVARGEAGYACLPLEKRLSSAPRRSRDAEKRHSIMARRKIVAGNWKMHGRDAMAAQLAGAVAAAAPACETILCAPFPYLQRVRDVLAGSGVQLGAQTLSEHEDGAYTGEISAGMLLDCGCSHVIVGHSEIGRASCRERGSSVGGA